MIDLSEWPVGLRLVLQVVPFLLLILGVVINIFIAGSHQFYIMCRAFGRNRGLEDAFSSGGRRD